jgi:hypothetical protein
MRHSLTALMIVVGLLAAACSSAASTPQIVYVTPTPVSALLAATPAPAASPSPTEPSLQAAAAAYLSLVTTNNSELDLANAQFNGAGKDVAKLGQAWAAYVAVQEKFIAGAKGIAFPPAVQRDIDALVAATEETVVLERALAGDPLNTGLQAEVKQKGDAAAPLARQVRQVLGMPPLTATPAPANLGTIVFGDSYDAVKGDIVNPKTTFKVGAPVAWSAIFTEAAGATTITQIFSKIGTGNSEQAVRTTNEQISSPDWTRLYNTYPNMSGMLGGAGTYILRYFHGATLLAEGKFTIG